MGTQSWSATPPGTTAPRKGQEGLQILHGKRCREHGKPDTVGWALTEHRSCFGGMQWDPSESTARGIEEKSSAKKHQAHGTQVAVGPQGHAVPPQDVLCPRRACSSSAPMGSQLPFTSHSHDASCPELRVQGCAASTGLPGVMPQVWGEQHHWQGVWPPADPTVRGELR